MDKLIFKWSDIEEDHPIEFIHRKRIFGANTMVAMVRLDKGCHVAPHCHISEQIAYIISGCAVFGLGEIGTEEHREVQVGPGDVVVLPSNFTHYVNALEDSLILDILSPPGEMGIDSQHS